MKIYGISDLHLDTMVDKPMDKFGQQWNNHWDKIKEDWKSKVEEDDIILIPGDISWAMEIIDAYYDLYKISILPGNKVLCRGNHDFWWKSLKKVNRLGLNKVFFIQNNSTTYGNYSFCGARGWINPGNSFYETDDEKIYKRELLRLELSLKSAPAGTDIIVLVHYPPFTDAGGLTDFHKIIKDYDVKAVVYGHLHNAKRPVEGVFDGIAYYLVSCDYLDFKLREIF